MEGILSKGITFTVNNVVVPGLQEIPSLGGTPNKIDITTLDDGAYHYMNGLKDYGDLDFTFLLAPDYSNYEIIANVEGKGSQPCMVRVGAKVFKFDAELTPSIDSTGIDAAIKFTVRAGLSSDITMENAPAADGQM